MAAPLLTRKTAILAKVESSYGVDPTPTGADNSILTSIPSLSIDPQVLERNVVTGTLSPTQPVIGRKLARASFQTEFKSQDEILPGSSSDPLEIDPLLRMAGLVPTYTAETSGGANDGYVTYAPVDGVTDPFESSTMYVYQGDQVLHKILGAFANLSMDFVAGQYPMMNVEATGKYTEPTDASSSGITYATDLPVQSESLSLAFGAVTGIVCRNFSINLNNEIIERPDVNSAEGLKGIRISGRRPTVSFKIEKELVATWNIYNALDVGTTYNTTFTHGSTAGNKILVTIPKLTILNVSESDENGISMLDVEAVCSRTDADDEISFKFF